MEKWIQLSRQKIHYFDTQGAQPEEGSPLLPALLFVHGNSASANSFMPQFESHLAETFRLIALDLPGHGESSHLTGDESYSTQSYARILCEFIERLDLNKAVWVGHSLGGHIILQALGSFQNPAGVFIFGTPPLGNPPNFADAFLSNPDVAFYFKGHVTHEEARRAVQQLFAHDKTGENSLFERDFLRTDPDARIQVVEALGRLDFTDEIQTVLGLSCPIAVVYGDQERLISLDYIEKIRIPSLWRGAVQIIQGAGHLPHWECSDDFNQKLKYFGQEVFGLQPVCLLS